MSAQPEATFTTRQRTVIIRPRDEEEAIQSQNGQHPHQGNVKSPTKSEKSHLSMHIPDKKELVHLWDRFTRKGKRKIGVAESLHAIFFSSWLNIFLVLIVPAWVSSLRNFSPTITFTLTFLTIIPLERLFDYGGEQMAHYLGVELGDLVIITLNNAVEATLAIILLKKCELVILKSTIVGVVILHLLLVPGTAFVTGGARIIQQDLHPHLTELNHTLLTLGVLSLMIPAAFFAAIDGGFVPTTAGAVNPVVNDEIRGMFLKMSRGVAILLLCVYICSRIYLHNPPGDDNALSLHLAADAPEAFKHEAAHLQEVDPEVNQWVCLAMLAICIGLMAATAEFMVRSIEFVREKGHIQVEWFGLILLPLVSFAADGTVASAFFVQYLFRQFFQEPTPPPTLAKGRAIDLSIQFTLFWMPFFVLLGWWIGKPMTILFDLFEVCVLIGACFIVNYVTADSKTNWAEGVAMVSFYFMIALCSWFYTGQTEVNFMSQCGTVAAAIAKAASGQEA